jgi:hypothetical protein
VSVVHPPAPPAQPALRAGTDNLPILTQTLGTTLKVWMRPMAMQRVGQLASAAAMMAGTPWFIPRVPPFIWSDSGARISLRS